ncbi:hypothetical protein DIPPA_30765 [Diplonema papillatum]|nr:hypothetical protein DIPPA_30765 [Diplonema papillatum]
MSPGAASWLANALTSSMRSGLSEIREAMVKEVDVERQKHAVLHSSFFGHTGNPKTFGTPRKVWSTPVWVDKTPAKRVAKPPGP